MAGIYCRICNRRNCLRDCSIFVEQARPGAMKAIGKDSGRGDALMVNTAKFYADIYQPGIGYSSSGDSPERIRQLAATYNKWAAQLSIAPDAKVLEIGCGHGGLHFCHPSWQGVEHSSTAVEQALKIHGAGLNIFQGDARELPLPANSIDFIFTFAALEHIPEVERAFREMERVLKPGGFALLCPAWNCRPWTVKKLQQRPYSELSLSEKIGKLLIPLRENIFFRLVCATPARLIREIKLLLGAPVELEYKALTPDFSLLDRYPHIADDDAFVSIDAHAAMAYFEARGWTCISHQNLWRRFSCRGEGVVVQKPR